MSLNCLNPRIIATYGVGSGNAPALSNRSVGHLRVAFFYFLNPISYVYHEKRGRISGPVFYCYF